MFLRCNSRFKDGKEHRYWNIVENKRVAGGRSVQRQVLYLGEINDSQKLAWQKTINVFEDGHVHPRQMSLFPSDHVLTGEEVNAVQVRLNEMSLLRPRQWGACWLCNELWDQIDLDAFWSGRLPPSREGTRWLNVFKTLTAYRMIEPGSEWRLHRLWFENSAMGDLLGEGFDLAEKNKLYRCMDKLLEHKQELFSFLKGRWENMFDVKFDVLFYDLTSTYFESDPPKEGLRRYGYSRDKRFDCLQVVIALIVTRGGFPLAYEVMPGNTQDKSTLKDFLKKIESQYGKADRIWIMDRGIPTEDVLAEMRESDPPTNYLVGTPRGRLTELGKKFSELPWKKARESVDVKLLQQDGELYILAKSEKRFLKESGIRKRKFIKLWNRLKELRSQVITRDKLLMKIGAAKKEAGRTANLINIDIPKSESSGTAVFTFSVNKEKIKAARQREGHYLLRSNLTSEQPENLWESYMLLTEIEQSFKDIKGDLSVRPIHHQKDERIEAHIFVAFMSYCLFVTLKKKLADKAPGLTPRSIIDKLKEIQMLDVILPTVDGRHLIMSRYTQPTKDHQLILNQLRLDLPPQPPPKITSQHTIIHKVN